MEALKLEVAVGADRRIVIDLPAEAADGRAEVIVLWSPARAVVRAGKTMAQLLDEFGARAARRTKAEIDQALEAERTAWD